MTGSKLYHGEPAPVITNQGVGGPLPGGWLWPSPPPRWPASAGVIRTTLGAA